MSEFEGASLAASEVYDLLVSKGIKHLYHANTVSTSLTFIECGALVSRAYVEAKKLKQTPQKSDAKDQKFDVWDHVFLDGFDLHEKYAQDNKYGPVLFLMSLELLKDEYIQEVFVTKSNPMYWQESTSPENRFYSNISDLDSDYLTKKKIDAQIMFTFRNPDLKISLKRYLTMIGVDCPSMLISLVSGEEMSVGDYAVEAIRKSLNCNNLNVEVMSRHKAVRKLHCGCHRTYNRLSIFNRAELKRLFAK